MQVLFQRGERTSTDVASAINQFAQARISVASAEAGYQVSLANLAGATGCLLGHSGVEWQSYLDLESLEQVAPISHPLPIDAAGIFNRELSQPDLKPGDPAKDKDPAQPQAEKNEARNNG